ncbi:MAG: hypothetical protein KAU20_02770 [Nanoarchaeota archaeon]|nr:hypothetical protein [Nanoarchaeota archaeon]
MKNKLYFTALLSILLIPSAFADINLTTNFKEKYNLGDSVRSSFDVNVNEDFSGLFKLTLFCDNFNIDYFVTLIDAKQDEKMTIEPPKIKPNDRMGGNCRLIVSLESLDKEIFEKFDSTRFEVTDKLAIQSDVSEDLVLPGEAISVNGKIDASFDNSDALSAVISFDGTKEELVVRDGEFSKELKISDVIASGEHTLFLEAKDSFGNNGDKSINIMVKPEISKINLELNKNSFKPKETIEIKPVIYDQADEAVLEEDVLVQIFKGSDELFSEYVESREKARYTFLEYAEPGEYSIKVTYDDLETEETIFIEEVKKLDINLWGELVNIKNIGNVRYDDVLNVNLFGEEKSYILDKRVKLNPSEFMIVDLSKGVPTDNYSIEVAVGDENISLTTSTLIEDKRSPLNKITTALIIAGKDILTDKPVFASIVMFLIITSIISFFMIKRKKKKFI